MALSDDQRAMLRLLARGEEGYEDIAALKGISVEEAKAAVKEALAAAAEDTPAAEPEPPTPAAEPPAEKRTPAAEPVAPPPTEAPPTAHGPAPGRSRTAIAPERRRVLSFAAAAVAAVAIVLGAIAIFGDSDDDAGEGGAASAEAVSGEAGQSGQLTQAELRPVAGQSGEGRAIFGRVGKGKIVLQVAAQGLDPTGDGESYTVWLYRSPKLALRIGAIKVGDAGRLGAQLPIPAELLAYVAAGAFDQVYLSRTDDAAFQAAVAKAKDQGALPPYTGETVLTGEITGPVVKAAAGRGG